MAVAGYLCGKFTALIIRAALKEVCRWEIYIKTVRLCIDPSDMIMVPNLSSRLDRKLRNRYI